MSLELTFRALKYFRCRQVILYYKHSVHPPPSALSAGMEVEPPTKFSKWGRLARISIFREGLNVLKLEALTLGIYNVLYPFHVTGLFLCALKRSGNQRFSNVFKGYRKRPVAWNGLDNMMLQQFYWWERNSRSIELEKTTVLQKHSSSNQK